MDTSILNTDTYIDAYWAGTLSQEDLQAFEKQLQTDKQLQMSVALHREMIQAIRERRMRELVTKFEADDRRRKTLRRIAKWTITTLSPIAIAACLFGFIIYMPQVNNINSINSSSSVFAQATNEIMHAYTDLKGCEDVAETLIEASDLMILGDFEQADKLLSSELKQHKDITAADTQAWSEKEDMLYLQALCAIHKGQVYRSRALLTKVISMHGIHEADATELLNLIKHGK